VSHGEGGQPASDTCLDCQEPSERPRRDGVRIAQAPWQPPGDPLRPSSNPSGERGNPPRTEGETTMKNFDKALIVLPISIALLWVSPSHASTLWDESIDGDLSNDELAPTDLPALDLGSNLIFGSIGLSSSSDDGDTARFTVPTGWILSQVVLETYQDGAYYDYVPFSLYRGASTSDPLVESILLSESSAGTDLLQFDSAPGPQPAGDYAFEFGSIHQANSEDERSLYSIRLNIIPEPSTMLLFAVGLAGVAGMRCGRKKARKGCQEPVFCRSHLYLTGED